MTSAGLILRRLTEDDSIDRLTDLLHRAYAPLAAAGMRYLASHQDAGMTRRRCSNGECWVADRGGRVVGTITWRRGGDDSPSAWYRRPDVAIFSQFAVEPDFQRAGIGRLLLDHVEQRARESGFAEVACDTSVRATALREWYARRGYRDVEKIRWPDVNDSSVVLSRSLGTAADRKGADMSTMTAGQPAPKPVRAPRGTKRACANWQIEAPYRMIQNNLDPEVAEDWKNLVVYGGSGKAARSWDAFRAILKTLKSLKKDETLLVQSGKPVGVFATHEMAPRVLIANSNLVPAWGTWEHFRKLEAEGLIMFGQMTAGSWIYIGTQGILQGTYETFMAASRRHFGGDLRGRLVLTGGLGGMGGAQPLAVTMAGGVCIAVEVDESRIDRRIASGYCDRKTGSLDEALSWAEEARREGRPLSIGLLGNCADLVPEFVRRRIVPDVVTDQTSAHDELNGYVPNGLPYADAAELRRRSPETYIARSMSAMAQHCRGMLALKGLGSVVFDYGNNLRGQAKKAGVDEAFDFPGFVPAYIRPMFCEGRGPFRWVALSGDPRDIHATDEAVLKLFPKDKVLANWIPMARERVRFQGLPARICWLGYGERAEFGLLLNRMVRQGRLKAPIVIGRDHLDCGSVASPYRETEGMKDGTDAVADWPLLNAMINTAAGATWVSLHHGGGVGIGNSIHAGMVVVADGSRLAEQKLKRVLTTDPGMGIVRHVDAGYEEAARFARKRGVRVPR